MTTPCPSGPGLSRALLVSALALLTGLLLALGVILFVTLGWAGPATPIPSKVFVAAPERVIDGDSVVYPQGVCRLLGVDAPERARGGQPGQPLAEEAWRALQGELLRGPNTVLVYAEKDRYGRMLCAILDAQGYVVNIWLVESGFAEAYLTDRAPFAAGLLEAESRAKTQGRGIWQLPNRESPAAYRKRLKEER